ncbi:MAG TPA: LptA/OstA family protein, partial [Verrucomicrobiae bacterium]|nr:LptA/OstA family protein [Verrucomicrobiae bacterium]
MQKIFHPLWIGSNLSGVSQTRNAFRASALFFAGIAAAFWTAAMLEVRAQQLVQGSSLKLADYYPAPHETEMKSLVQGQRARPQGAGKVLIDQARLETFRETGDHEFVAEAPQCLLDQTSHVLQSPGPIEVRTADGKFVLDGEGFLWLQTNSVLFISNHVHTTIQPELMSESPEVATKASGQAKRPPVEIFSDRFKYERQTGLAVYRENVRASGTNMALASSVLTMVLPMAEHQLKSVTADERVVMDYSGVHATGEHATYDVATEIAHVTGHPAWHSEQREGRG